ncbi:Type 1 glutamine amidotransferase-like domain-containing protein [Cytobacillus sp. Hm23]
MKDRYLFLFGGSPSLLQANQTFVQKCRGKKAHIALLITYSPKWKEYLSYYAQTWEEIGINSYSVIMPDENNQLDYEQATNTLAQSTGIFIGGGSTYEYHKQYTKSPIKQLIKEHYYNGIPVAGCSAGALISLTDSFISPDESKTKEIEMIKGIGLLSNILIGVHYTEDKQEPYLHSALNQTSIPFGYGIDENACVVFKNEEHLRNIGSSVHSIKMSSN